MKASSLKWVQSAEEEYQAAVFLMKQRGRTAPLNSICFHSRQCLEWYLKGRLEDAGLPVPKTDNLAVLLNRVLYLEPLWASFQSSVATVKDYTVEFLYPGHLATRKQADEALKICNSMRKEIRLALGLSAK